MLTHKITNEFYFGYREKNKVCSIQDLGIKYFTSSKHIKSIGFDNFNFEVLAEFFNEIDAYDFEQELIKENKKNPLCLNRHYTNGKAFRYMRKLGDYKTSEETKRKQSIAHTGKIVSEETRQKISKIHTGKIVSEETKQKISKSGKGRIVSEETKQKISKSGKGLSRPPVSIETKQKMSKAQKLRKHNKTSEETKEKLRNSALNMSSETKERLRIAAIEMWKRRKAVIVI